jgi:hypothetical protein
MLQLFKRSTSPEPGHGTGRDGSMAASSSTTRDGGREGRLICDRRHIDFIEHEIPWRRLLDSYEGGDRYRNAVYGPDRKGLPCRNLFRHRREYPDPTLFPSLGPGFPSGLAANNPVTEAAWQSGQWPGMVGADQAATAQDDDYELRRSSTPVPEFMSGAVDCHLGKVYGKEVDRDETLNPKQLVKWWGDVDGAGTGIDDWMRDTIAPLVMVLGCLDIVFDHPAVEPGAKVATRADEIAAGLDKCIASYILPNNMVWWKLNSARRYDKCLVREYADPSDRIDTTEIEDKKTGKKTRKSIDPDEDTPAARDWRENYLRFRYWTSEFSILYNFDGSRILEPKKPHGFGRVPILRLIDLKKHRTPNIGKSRYEMVCEYTRTFYNIESELRLNGTLQSSPLLSGSKNFCKADNTISVGVGYILPIDILADGSTLVPWSYVSPPSDPSDSLRQDKADIVDAIDRKTCQTKPAGVKQGGASVGGGASVVAQSGVSKQLDASSGHILCTDIARSLARCERDIAEYALLVLENGNPSDADLESITITYPANFDLQSAGEITDDVTKFTNAANGVGDVPTVQADGLKDAMRKMKPGQTDEEYAAKDDEIDQHVAKMGSVKQAVRKAGIADLSNALEGAGTSESAGGSDPGGVSGGSAVSGNLSTV